MPYLAPVFALLSLALWLMAAAESCCRYVRAYAAFYLQPWLYYLAQALTPSRHTGPKKNDDVKDCNRQATMSASGKNPPSVGLLVPKGMVSRPALEFLLRRGIRHITVFSDVEPHFRTDYRLSFPGSRIDYVALGSGHRALCTFDVAVDLANGKAGAVPFSENLDLIVVASDVLCLKGLPPLAIKLTEFVLVPAPSPVWLNYALIHYSHCSHRYGK